MIKVCKRCLYTSIHPLNIHLMMMAYVVDVSFMKKKINWIVNRKILKIFY